MVDAVLEQQLERGVGLGLGERAERRGAEDRARALVAGAPERRSSRSRLEINLRGVPYDLIAVGDVMLDGTLPAPVAGGRVHGRIELARGRVGSERALAAARLGARAAVSAGSARTPPAGWWRTSSPRPASRRCSRSTTDAPTGCVVVVGGTSIVADPGASARLAPDDLPATLEAGAVLVSGYTLLQRGSEPAARAALERARTDWLAVDVGVGHASSRRSASSVSWRRRRRSACCWRTPRRREP